MNRTTIMPDTSETKAGKAGPKSLPAMIAEQPFLKGLDARQLQLLTESALEMRFQPGEWIFQEGSPADRFYLILEGKVEITSEVKEHCMAPIQTLGPGDDLGWSWLFPPGTCTSALARWIRPVRYFSMEPGCASTANKTMTLAMNL